MTVVLRWDETGAGPICRSILAGLPEWFGIPDAVDDYVEVAEISPTLVATDSRTGKVVGVLTLVTHSLWAAEIYVMAVSREAHRSGVGTQLLRAAEDRLRIGAVEYLQVKTLSESHPDTGYAKTRAFYLANGFSVLEEFPEMWGADSPAVQLIKALGPS